MIGLIFAIAGAVSLVIVSWYGARWAFAIDKSPRQKRDELEAFLKDPTHYGRKGT